MDTLFKFVTEQLGFELEGSEEFVREQMQAFLPFVQSVAGTGAEAEEAEEEGPLRRWYRETVPEGQTPNMQDHILVFAYFLYRQKRQFIFVPDDMKASFEELKREVPKSLLQIMGSLKRDQGMLYPGNKRGEYSLTPEGIRYVEKLLGIQKPQQESGPAPEVKPPPDLAPAPSETPEDSPAREKFTSLFKGKSEGER